MLGFGLKENNFELDIDWSHIDLNFMELIPENWLYEDKATMTRLLDVLNGRPIYLHGLFMNIGGTDDLDKNYLNEIKLWIKKWRIPVLGYSDHFAFTQMNQKSLLDLMPPPFTEEVVKSIAKRANYVQDYLDLPFSLENVSLLEYNGKPELTEFQFISGVLSESDIGLHFDLNNLNMNCLNFKKDFMQELNQFMMLSDRIRYIHMANGEEFDLPYLKDIKWVDTHGANMDDITLKGLSMLLESKPFIPVCLERDANCNSTDILNELKKLKQIIELNRKGF